MKRLVTKTQTSLLAGLINRAASKKQIPISKKICPWCWSLLLVAEGIASNVLAVTVSTPYGTSYQVNVNAAGQNIMGDAANEPSICLDPTNPNRVAVGWRQFDTVTNSFRQAGWAYSTNSGLNWTFPGVLTPGVFRSDPVLAVDGAGRFYYFSLMNSPNFHCDLWRSTNGGMNFQRLGEAFGGDQPWMTIDNTAGIGRGNIYQMCSPDGTYSGNPNNMFTRSIDGGLSWMTPIAVPQYPFGGNLEVGPNGELFGVGIGGSDASIFWVNRSTNAQNPSVTPTFDLTRQVNLGGAPIYGVPGINPEGFLGTPWIAVDRSTGATRSNVYLLCTVTGTGNPANVMFARSTNRGATWSAPRRINDDAANQNAYHWFGTLSVAPNGRIDACWNDTRHSTNNSTSELYYTWSENGGLTWATNRPISPPFNHSLGYPVQQKMGDYLGMISLNEGACIAYTATFNGEEDIYFVRPELPITANITRIGNAAHISWNAVPGGSYCVQVKTSLSVPWSGATNVACVVATNSVAAVDESLASGASERFYRVVRQP